VKTGIVGSSRQGDGRWNGTTTLLVSCRIARTHSAIGSRICGAIGRRSGTAHLLQVRILPDPLWCFRSKWLRRFPVKEENWVRYPGDTLLYGTCHARFGSEKKWVACSFRGWPANGPNHSELKSSVAQWQSTSR
jgi:hypothetical protein